MARGVWKGAIGFGLVTIGVELYNVEAPERLDLDLLDKRDMARIGYLKINKSTGKPVEPGDIVRGYAVEKNQYVILNDADIKEANPRKSQTIDVLGFVAASDIPLLYYDKPYLVAPTKGSEKAYLLFKDTLEEMERVAIAQIVMRTRQYLTAVYPYGDTLVAQLLRYDDEVRKAEDLGITVSAGGAKAVRPAELAMAKKLVEGMEMEWDASQYHDEYRADLLKLIKQRAKGAKPAQEPAPAPKETKVIDLMEALRRSVGEQGASKRKPAVHRKRATRKSA
jgi:DNA end-binding protein Ku